MDWWMIRLYGREERRSGSRRSQCPATRSRSSLASLAPTVRTDARAEVRGRPSSLITAGLRRAPADALDASRCSECSSEIGRRPNHLSHEHRNVPRLVTISQLAQGSPTGDQARRDDLFRLLSVLSLFADPYAISTGFQTRIGATKPTKQEKESRLGGTTFLAYVAFVAYRRSRLRVTSRSCTHLRGATKATKGATTQINSRK